MTTRWTVTVTDLPPEMGSTWSTDYTADDDATTDDIATSVRSMLPAAAFRAGIDNYDEATATIDVVAVGG